MSAQCDTLPVVPGHNIWVLARTDRDAATKDEVLDTASAFLSRTLGPASPANTRNLLEVYSPCNDASRYVIGAARPVLVKAHQPATIDETLRLSRPRGEPLGLYNNCPVLRTVNATRPWVVVAEFDWRGRRTDIPWPKRLVNDLGFSVESDHNLDWLLLGASYTGAPVYKDQDWTDSAVGCARAAIPNVVPWLVLGVAGIGVGFGIALAIKAKKATR